MPVTRRQTIQNRREAATRGPRDGRVCRKTRCRRSSYTTPKTISHPTKRPTDREKALLDNKYDLRPLHDPLFAFEKESIVRPETYLFRYLVITFGQKVADWTKGTFGLARRPTFRKVSYIDPIRPKATTMISLFYYHESSKRPLDTYLSRLRNLADMGEQTIIYVPPALATQVRAMRCDIHWVVVDDFDTVWDFPNNRYQHYNFTHKQPAIFSRFEGAIQPWQLAYNRPFLSAVSNAKAFCTFDAVMRNPFGSDTWMWLDAGLYDEGGPKDADGVTWGDLKYREQLDETKIARSIGLSRDTGIFLGEHPKNPKLPVRDINHECWTDPKEAWMAHRFAAGLYVGSSIGMLNYSIRFMQTVDDLDAKNRYSGREEFVIAFLAASYPNTVFSIPFEQPVPKPGKGKNELTDYPFKPCYTTQGGKAGSETVPLIVDPLSTMYCKHYDPRQPHLPAGGTPDYLRDAVYK